MPPQCIAEIAQMVEQWTENPRVRSSILRLGTSKNKGLWGKIHSPFFIGPQFLPL
jgi:hypothetical protein